MSVSTTQPSAKKINIAYLLMSVLPLVIMICLITAAQLPAVFVGTYEQANAGEEFNLNLALNYPMAQWTLAIGFITYAVIMIVSMTIWYRKAFLKNTVAISNKESFSVKAIVITLIGIFGALGLVESFLTVFTLAAPSKVEEFVELMHTSGIGSNPLITIVYACILGPITEELVFRGVTQSCLTKANLPVSFVILIQAIFFGIAHMNLVQGSYAVILGVVLGIIRWKLGNVRIVCLFHILYNSLATYGSDLLESLNLPDAAYTVIYAVLGVIGIGLIFYLLKQPTRQTQEAVAVS